MNTMIIEAVIVGGPDDGKMKKFRVPERYDRSKVTRIKTDDGVTYALIYIDPSSTERGGVLAYHPSAARLLT